MYRLIRILADFILPKLLGTPFPIFNHVHKINNSKRLDMNQLYRKFKDLPPEAQNVSATAFFRVSSCIFIDLRECDAL